MRKITLVSLAMGTCLLAACAAKPPIVAQEKTVEVDGINLVFGGSYDTERKNISLSVNGDSVMKGTFPPYTPTQNLSGKYKGYTISSQCYFGSVLSSQGGAFGAIAGVIQSTKSSSGDKCDMLVNGKIVESLYF
ncbi:Uncharacterised protein [Shewanella putrefaciens]|uniref:Lipoprotein n=1 Tax=Shewanella sp. (strain MR-7) TaxID=60481 RepID=Q0HZG1_SHESR|nr:hypothetical protein [Shewanella sp. ANA-3]ABK49856.1 hypothetical protein Shewana3_3636 [Shewanella sp. ANA-3]VEE61596.1 Uncharacterised protein [Shewanella putrefaciens]